MADLREQLQSSLGTAYRVERELGGGAMARVFVAVDETLGRPVAIKVLPPELGNELSLERFRREVRVAAQLQHPHIVPVLSAGDASGLLYYTTPFVPGETLRDRLNRERQLPAGDAVRLTMELAGALAYAHGRGVVHRDVKPENVLLSDGHALLTDFGIAKAIAQSTTEALTATGLSLGTPQYMAPEQAAGTRDVDGRADIYSLGCVLYELLTGQPPFSAPSAQGIVAQHFTAPFPRARHSRPDVPAAIDDVIAMATTKTASDRFATATEFASALATATRQRGQGRRRRLATRPVSVAAIAIVSVIAYTLARARPLRDRAGQKASTGQSKSVAVLPFSAVGADTANAYYADGMTEALISALSNVRGLRVTPRSSVFALKGTKLAARQIGETLHVGTILDGSVQRAGNRLRISVSLSDPAHDSALWSATYDGDRGDVFGMQDSIAKAVVGALRVQLVGAAPLVRRATTNEDAYDLYLQGRALAVTLTEPNILKGIVLFEQALRRDSTFALAYSGLADAYSNLADVYWAPVQAYPKAKEAALRALALDSTLAETRMALGQVKMSWDWDFAGGERELRRAIDLAPSNALAHGYLAYELMLSRPNEALSEAQRVIDLDPLSSAFWSELVYFFLEDTDRLRDVAQRFVLADSTDDISRGMLAFAEATKGDSSRARALVDGHPCTIGYYCATQGLAYARLGDRAAAERSIQRFLELARHQYVPPDAVGWVYASLGDRDRAIDAFARAVDAHSGSVIVMKTFPLLAPLRSDPRFQALIKRVGLP